ncbi:MAG: sn-glycerol-1-phosphate dehydrogenase [Clostridia bacterium]|nr:sn-glycerol-1-phosphate dehydrogenase [Clostridia bacterium]
MEDFKKIFTCECGKIHNALIDEYVVEKNAISRLADYVKKYNGTKAFILADKNTYLAGGQKAISILEQNAIPYSKYIFNQDNLSPNESAVGSAIMHYDKTCDIIIAVGSGVINDIGKILAKTTSHPYIIVATAPSMDGYASATSSMDMDGLKVSLPTTNANVVIGDIDILKTAPDHMLSSGLGDMLAKYVSIAEWKIANIITGEYYCQTVADIVMDALNDCVKNAKGLLKRENEAIKAVFKGLVLCGVAMNYAGLSRPASGVEHYFSHVWDMRGLEFNIKTDLHGIQCAVGTLYATKIYEQVKKIVPDKKTALNFAKSFDYNTYCEFLKEFLGKGAISMIELDKKERKYDLDKHQKRFDVIANNWDKILEIINEMPSSNEIESLLDTINAPKSAKEMGIDDSNLKSVFLATKDIRDKYVLSRLCWDLGIIDQIKI